MLRRRTWNQESRTRVWEILWELLQDDLGGRCAPTVVRLIQTIERVVYWSVKYKIKYLRYQDLPEKKKNQTFV